MKTPKNAKEIICEKCNFKCFKNSEYKRHLITAKHKNRTFRTEKTPKNAIIYSCDCGKTYKSRSSLWYHKKKCSHSNRIEQENHEENHYLMKIISQNKEIMDALVLQNEELQRQNKEQSDTIKELIPKIGNNNNNNNNTINNHFNIQNFLYEDCKDAINFSEFIDKIQISFEDLEQQSQIGFIKGISKLFIENLHELGTHKRPIHCTDKKRKTLYI